MRRQIWSFAFIWTAAVLMPGAGNAAEVPRNTLAAIQISLPNSWKRTDKGVRNTLTFVAKPAKAQEGLGPPSLRIWVEHRLDADDALLRLHEFSANRKERVEEITIDGWPGLQREYRGDLRHPVSSESESDSRQGAFVSTMIAVGDEIVGAEAAVPLDDREAATRLVEVRRALAGMKLGKHGNAEEASRNLDRVRHWSSEPPSPHGPPGGHVPSDHIPIGLITHYIPSIRPVPQFVGATGQGELEVAVSGQQVAIFSNSLFNDSIFLANGGAFTSHNFPFEPPGAALTARGDPSVKLARSGAFYASEVATATKDCRVSVSQMTTFPTFAFQSFAKACTDCLEDQPLLAADRWNPSPGGDDQIYATWRNFDASGDCSNLSNGQSSMHLVCSSDGGATWINETSFGGSGDFARPTVGRTGDVYVLYRDGNSLMLDRFGSCSSGLHEAQGFPVEIVDSEPLDCPIPGIDRCDSTAGVSYSIAPDDTKDFRVVVAHSAKGAQSGTDIIEVNVSDDSGRHWSDSEQVSDGIPGRRYFPAVCVTAGNAFVGWYDRRAATSSQNDLTDYYLGSYMLEGRVPDAPSVEINLTQIPDPQCDSGWPVPPESEDDATSCSHQPQLAGVCEGSSPKVQCQFGGPACPNGKNCVTDGGFPKYGDYNGIACDSGSIVAAWASATAPGFLASLPAAQIELFAARVQPPTVTFSWEALPLASVPRMATVQVDTTDTALVFDKGSTGQIVVGPGSHQFSVSGIWGTANMSTVFGGACDASGNFSISNGQHIHCSATTTITGHGLCLGQCTTQHETCLSQPGPKPSLSDPTAIQDHQKECQDNFAACLKRCGGTP